MLGQYQEGVMKRNNLNHSIVIIAVFVWIGFVCSISFMEAWLKFRPMNVTLPIGLSIGRLIFDALNKMEWIFAFIIIAHILLSKNRTTLFHLIFLAIPIVLLILQTFLLLPALNERVEMILSGNEVSSSFLHFYYLTMELIKVVSLFVFGVFTFIYYENRVLLNNSLKSQSIN